MSLFFLDVMGRMGEGLHSLSSAELHFVIIPVKLLRWCAHEEHGEFKILKEIFLIELGDRRNLGDLVK